LRVPVVLDGLRCTAYLDTGAGVIVLGGGWLEKRRQAGMGKPKLLPTKIELKGVNSGALAGTTGIAKVQLTFLNKKESRTVQIQGVVCPSWEGDVIISWGALLQMGFSIFTEPGTSKTTITFRTLGISVVPEPISVNFSQVFEKGKSVAGNVWEFLKGDHKAILEENGALRGEVSKRERSWRIRGVEGGP